MTVPTHADNHNWGTGLDRRTRAYKYLGQTFKLRAESDTSYDITFLSIGTCQQ